MRQVPQHPFPDYAYIPGTRNKDEKRQDIPHFENQEQAYLYGVDLFNHQFYYEAHEVWEELWHQVGHKSKQGLFLKALIQLAGYKLKKLMGQTGPAERLKARAFEILASLDSEKYNLKLLKKNYVD